jgi:hypothetical protein
MTLVFTKNMYECWKVMPPISFPVTGICHWNKNGYFSSDLFCDFKQSPLNIITFAISFWAQLHIRLHQFNVGLFHRATRLAQLQVHFVWKHTSRNKISLTMSFQIPYCCDTGKQPFHGVVMTTHTSLTTSAVLTDGRNRSVTCILSHFLLFQTVLMNLHIVSGTARTLNSLRYFIWTKHRNSQKIKIYPCLWVPYHGTHVE